MSEKVVEVEFNEAQKKAMACALMAVAEEVANSSTQNRLKHGDTIDLLSDTDSNSNSELLGVLDADTNEPPSNALDVRPLKLEVQVKEEFLRKVATQPTLNRLLAAKPAQPPDPANRNSLSSQFAPPPFASSMLDGLGSLPANTFVTLVDLGANEMRVEECDTACALVFGARNESIKDEASAEARRASGTTVAAGIYKISEDQETLQTTAAEGIMTGDTRSMAATIATDQLDWSMGDVNEGLLESFTCDSDDVDNGMLGDDNIITLDGSGDDDDDEVLETKLISLLDTDSETDNRSQQANRNTIDMLMHYICPECNLECGSLLKWKAHTDTAHDFRSVTKLNLETVISREGRLCYQCKFCGQKFKNDTNFARLLKHRIVHMPYPDYFKCRLCNKRMKVLCSLRQHLRHIHAKICKQYTNTRDNYRQYIEYHCPICNKIISNYVKWKSHLEETHSYSKHVATRVRPIRDSIVACRDCDNEFNKRSIAVHVMKHEPYRSFHCKVCKSFDNNQLARCVAHVRTAHFEDGGRTYKCEYCETQFDSPTERNNHLKRDHHIHKVQCEVCQKSFANGAMLIAHMNLKNHQKLK